MTAYLLTLLWGLADAVPNDSSLLAPGAMILSAAGLFAAGMREYRATRQSDVVGERARRLEAEAREKATETGLESKVEALTQQIKKLEEKINGQQLAHDRDIEARRTRELHLSNVNFGLRQLLADNGISIPDGLK